MNPKYKQELDALLETANISEEEREAAERRRREFKEKLEYWRQQGSPISIPMNFRA